MKKYLLLIICCLSIVGAFAQCTAVTINSQPGDQSLQTGQSATLSFSVNGTAPFSYFWYKNGAFFTQTSSPTLTTGALSATDNGTTYYCKVTNCNSQQEAITRTVTLSVSALCNPVSIASQIQDQTTTEGNAITFNFSVAGDAPFSYFWYKNGAFITQTSSPSYTTPTLSTADNNSTYYCQVTNCNNTQGAATRTATIIVNSACSPVTISSQPGSQSVNAGSTATLSFTVYGTAPFSYFWYKNGTFLTQTANPTYTTPPLATTDNGTTYYCQVTNCNSTQAAQTSVATLTVLSQCTPVTIVSQPQSINVNTGINASFNVATSGTGPFNYFWFKDGVQIVGAISSAYTKLNVSAADAGSYICKVTNCDNTYEAVSDAAVLTVSDNCIPVTVTSQPVDVIANTGGSATFNVQVSGSGPFSYFWYKDGQQILGAISSTYTRQNLTSTDVGSYSCRITNCNSTQGTQTNAAVLSFNTGCIPVTISAQPQNVITTPGTSATFSVSANGTGPFSYFWFKDGQQILGAISATYTRLNVSSADAGSYYCRVTNCNSTQGTVSNAGLLTIAIPTTPVAPVQYNAIQTTSSQYKTKDPIQIATGSYTYTHQDFRLPSIPDSLKFVRYYNSLNNAVNTPVGYGWSHSYNYYLNAQIDPSSQQITLYVISYPDGHSSAFVPVLNGNGQTYPLFSGTRDSLIKNSGGDFTLYTVNKRQYHFTPSGILDQILDMNGNATTLTYSNGNLTSVTGQGGRKLTFTYNGSNLSSVNDPGGQRTCSFSYDALGNLQTSIDPNGGVTTFSYDTAHRMTTVSNPLGNIIVKNTYDNVARVVNQSDANGQITSISYNSPSDGYATITNPDNSQITVKHDSAFRKTYIKDQLGFIQTYGYDASGNPATFTNEDGQTDTKL